MKTDNVYCCLLAGGVGSRMADFVRLWINEDRPKQFCRFIRDQTMVEHAWERGSYFCSPEHLLTIISDGQQVYLDEMVLPGETVVQPCGKGTGTAIALATALVLQKDPYAQIVFLPADHFIYPALTFANHIRQARSVISTEPDQVVTLAAKATHADTDYGWIAMGDSQRVSAFHEKPTAALAEKYFTQGYLWNTMITVAYASTLWEVISAAKPTLTATIARHLSHANSDIDALYTQLDTTDFSREIIERSVDVMSCVPMTDVVWSDWGRPERVVATIAELNLPCEIPHDLVERCRPQVATA